MAASAACSGDHVDHADHRAIATPPPAAVTSPVARETAIDLRRACGSTAIRPGSTLPVWARAGPALPYVITTEGNAVGILFADPLRKAPRSDGMNNKVLWVVREPRDGGVLRLDGRLGAQAVHVERPADSEPGEIYPSAIDAPVAGCWHFTLRWGSNTGHVDLLFQP